MLIFLYHSYNFLLSQDEMEVLEENQEKMQQELSNLKGRMKNMRAQNEKIESMLTALLKKHEVEWQEEDEQQDDSNI